MSGEDRRLLLDMLIFGMAIMIVGRGIRELWSSPKHSSDSRVPTGVQLAIRLQPVIEIVWALVTVYLLLRWRPGF